MNRDRQPVKSTSLRWFCRLLRDSRAATAVEYGLIVSLIIISMFTAFNSVAGVTTNMWYNINDKVVTDP